LLPRKRSRAAGSELVPHLVQVTNASFPSGHAMISSAVYLTLALMLAEGMPRGGGRVLQLARGADRDEPGVSRRALAERRAGGVVFRDGLGVVGVDGGSVGWTSRARATGIACDSGVIKAEPQIMRRYWSKVYF